jgi:hypothetical protein
MPIQKTDVSEHSSHDRWGTTPRCYTNEAGYAAAMHFKAEVGNIHYNQELLRELWFLS